MKRLSRIIYTPISTLDCSLLCRLHKNDSSLVRIIFSSRNLGSEGVNSLTQALQSNTNLTELDLSSNSIGSEGARLIASLLLHQLKTMIANGKSSEANGGIKTLLLADNHLGDAGLRAMAEALEKNIKLENLWIDENSISAKGLAILANALRENSNLKRLHIWHNSFQSISPLIKCTFNKQSLNSVADSNHTLKHVFLNCGYSYEHEELEKNLKINRMGKVAARRKKIALFLGEDLGRLLRMDLDTKLLPRLLGILGNSGSIFTLFELIRHIPSDVLAYYDPMDIDDPMDVE
mmetsp:Transcript_43948/g.92481  ORF Transcript_43948/g.92481 Transcript_43948/m.92481 type:complete len:292 (+) Transcript_43948:79-954(+)